MRPRHALLLAALLLPALAVARADAHASCEPVSELGQPVSTSLHDVAMTWHANHSSPSLYDREFERAWLDSALRQRPSQVLLILGPRNCGKTAILQSFFEGKRHAVYVDCRAMGSSNPTTFTSRLLRQLQPMAPINLGKTLTDLLRSFPSGLTLSGQGVSRSPPQADAASARLDKVFETLGEIFVAWQKEAQQNPEETYGPVLVIDEANELRSWADMYPAELHSLLQFFVKITKQARQCHVLMVTSEFSYQTWLNKFVGPGNWRPEVIGDFPETDARQYLFQLLGSISRSDGKSIDKDDKAWAAVYEVCGGNAGALGSLADRLREFPGFNWEQALKKLWQVELGRVRRLSEGGEAFAAVHYAAAALQLLDSQQAHNTVGRQDMQEVLGKYVEGTANTWGARVRAGAAVLKSLVQANALSVRPPSDWARDIPEEAFGNSDSLVTAPSTMDLYCMRRIRSELEQVLAEHDSEQQANPLQVGASPSSLPVAGPHG